VRTKYAMLKKWLDKVKLYLINTIMGQSGHRSRGNSVGRRAATDRHVIISRNIFMKKHLLKNALSATLTGTATVAARKPYELVGTGVGSGGLSMK